MVANSLGIVVFGFNWPYHFQAVLESLRLQGRIGDVHAWIDGTQARGEYLGANTKTIKIARRCALSRDAEKVILRRAWGVIRACV